MSTGYAVKEVFYTLQGEGARAGRPAVFLRFSGCNLWSGREEARATAICRFCDTDFVGTDGPGGGRFETPEALADHVDSTWTSVAGENGPRYVVCTGGEPLLQLDAALIAALHDRQFEIAVESNGTIKAPAGIDWLTISPKMGADLEQQQGDELKLVFPQERCDPGAFEALDFSTFYLQPMDGPLAAENTLAAVEYVQRHPRWSLSLQTHKYVGIP
jgi:7-carboxy-7-deazaguanine synthase